MSKKKIVLFMVVFFFLVGFGVWIGYRKSTDTGWSGKENVQKQSNLEQPIKAEVDLSRFYYNQLKDDEKEVYDMLLEHSDDLENELELEIGRISTKSFCKVHYALLHDHPELFWLSKFEGKTQEGILVSVTYEGLGRYRESFEKVNRIAEQIVSEIPSEYNTYEKVKYIYEYIIRTTDYVMGAENSQDIRSALIHKQTVCAGFASAFKFLCDEAGIQCIYVSGAANEVTHAWNMVEIDGKYYWVDTTWGDAASTKISFDYEYLCATDDVISGTHVVERGVKLADCYIPNVFSYPECNDDTYSH